MSDCLARAEELVAKSMALRIDDTAGHLTLLDELVKLVSDMAWRLENVEDIVQP